MKSTEEPMSWVIIQDMYNEESIIVRESSIASITCEALNLNDVNWYVQLEGDKLIRVCWTDAAELLRRLHITNKRPFTCAVCGGTGYWYSDEVTEEQGLFCVNDTDHRVYSKLGERHVRADIIDAWNVGKFGSIDNK